MKKLIVFLIYFFISSLAMAQDGYLSRSYDLNGKLDRTAPFTSQDGSAVQEVQNMVRPSPGTPVGWKCRSGVTKHNSTSLGAYQVESLHQFTNNDIGTDCFIAQLNDNLYLATNNPPDTGTTFGSSIYSLNSDSGIAYSAKVGDDWVGAAEGSTPWAWSGGIAYPDSVLINRNVSGVSGYHNGYFKVRDNDTDTYLTWLQDADDEAYIGFRRRIDGFYIDFISGATNGVASGVSIFARRSGAWTEVSGLSDGTASGTTPFFQSGLISWTASDNDEPYLLPNTTNHLFYYKVKATEDITDAIKAYRIRITEDCQAITALWSGRYDSAIGVIKSGASAYENYSGECTNGFDVDYMDVGGLTSSDAVYLGFAYPAFGAFLQVDSANSNSSVVSSVSVYYWNAASSSWTDVGTVSDGTKDIGYSLNHGGVVQWDGSAITEDTREFGGIPFPLYWYKFVWSATLPDSVFIWDVSEIQKPDTIITYPEYNGVIEYNGRAMFWPGHFDKSTIDFSEDNLAHVNNGPRAGSTPKGMYGPGEVNAVAKIHSYLGVSTKNPKRIYLHEGKTPDKFDELLISSTHGVLAPKTFIAVEDNVRSFTKDRNVHIAVFLDSDGFYMIDGMTVISISREISDLFDDSAAPYIELAYAENSYAWYDYKEKTVHFAVPVNTSGTGTQTTLNWELVYNPLTEEWYDHVIRNAPSACGLSVIDSNNERVTYYGDYAGYIYRGEGLDDAGTAITHYLKTVDFSPLTTGDVRNRSFLIEAVKAKAKSQTSGSIGLTIYPDGKTTGITPTSDMSLVNSGYKYVQGRIPVLERGELFSFKFESDDSMEIYSYTVDFMPHIETMTQ